MPPEAAPLARSSSGEDEVRCAAAAAAAAPGGRVEEVPHESADPARAQGTRADGGQDLRGECFFFFFFLTRNESF